ncbi:hypothetical protein D3C75_599020 [compost metagenome]
MRPLKVQEIIQLQESVQSFLDLIYQLADDPKKQDICSRYMATLMVIRDMDMRYTEEDHPLKSNTMIDFLYGDVETTKKALNAFRGRINANPRARILWTKYNDQFMDIGFGPKAMRYQIQKLADHFKRRKDERTAHHESTLVKNFVAAQDKIQSNYQEMTQ